ncbi:MAG TPA: hypothetical protein PKM43_14520 [Verrucomicrobiota bacterium]|nr:hypothetical protein [Verrucomicrobiota bacterium]
MKPRNVVMLVAGLCAGIILVGLGIYIGSKRHMVTGSTNASPASDGASRPASSSAESKWRIRATPDTINDCTNYFIWVRSEEKVVFQRSEAGYARYNIMLDEDGLTDSVWFPGRTGAGESDPYQYRVDKNEAETMYLGVSKGRDGDDVLLYLFSPTAAYKDWKVLRVRVGSAEATFDLTGLGEAVKGLDGEWRRRLAVERAEHEEQQSSRRAQPATQAADERKPMTEQERVDQLKRQSTSLPSAQYDLALRYLEGRGVQQDTNEARRLLKLATAGGYKPAVELATVEFLKERARQGSAWAAHELALCYLEGRSVEADSKEAIRLLKAAAAAGHEAAARKLKELEAARAATPVQTNVPGPTAAPEPSADGRKDGT